MGNIFRRGRLGAYYPSLPNPRAQVYFYMQKILERIDAIQKQRAELYDEYSALKHKLLELEEAQHKQLLNEVGF